MILRVRSLEKAHKFYSDNAADANLICIKDFIYKIVSSYEEAKDFYKKADNMITAAAIKSGNKTRIGLTHSALQIYFGQDDDHYGFVTGDGRFVSRKEAAKIAYANGQMSEEKEFLSSADIIWEVK